MPASCAGRPDSTIPNITSGSPLYCPRSNAHAACAKVFSVIAWERAKAFRTVVEETERERDSSRYWLELPQVAFAACGMDVGWLSPRSSSFQNDAAGWVGFCWSQAM